MTTRGNYSTGELAIYPGPAEAPEVPEPRQPWYAYRADLLDDWTALSALRLAAERRHRARALRDWQPQYPEWPWGTIRSRYNRWVQPMF